jgi:hypothetical protein
MDDGGGSAHPGRAALPRLPCRGQGDFVRGFGESSGAALLRRDLLTHTPQHKAMGICQPHLVVGH